MPRGASDIAYCFRGRPHQLASPSPEVKVLLAWSFRQAAFHDNLAVFLLAIHHPHELAVTDESERCFPSLSGPIPGNEGPPDVFGDAAEASPRVIGLVRCHGLAVVRHRPLCSFYSKHFRTAGSACSPVTRRRRSASSSTEALCRSIPEAGTGPGSSGRIPGTLTESDPRSGHRYHCLGLAQSAARSPLRNPPRSTRGMRRPRLTETTAKTTITNAETPAAPHDLAAAKQTAEANGTRRRLPRPN